jgi:hypothetical protein
LSGPQLAECGDGTLVVWEPILATDWRQPSGSTLGRIADGRARQFWDPKHVVSAELKDRATQAPPQPKPNCCIQNGFYWDEAILYPAGAHWKDAQASMFWNGLVVRIIPSLEKSLSEVH